MTRTWVHRITIKQICDIQKKSEEGVADSMYECIAAWRLFDAIEHWLAGEFTKAHDAVAKVRHDKFTDTDMLLRVQSRIGNTYRQQDPFTDTCVAAHQQWIDWQKLQQDELPDEQLARIVKRHEMYRLCQPELNPTTKEEA
jgi:hypothetical protein